jgi:hypothetical protein
MKLGGSLGWRSTKLKKKIVIKLYKIPGMLTVSMDKIKPGFWCKL